MKARIIGLPDGVQLTLDDEALGALLADHDPEMGRVSAAEFTKRMQGRRIRHAAAAVRPGEDLSLRPDKTFGATQ